jgi:tetratricopeptide (TPR) repeat protein
VEGAHFTRGVEALVRGKTGRDPYGDIDYALRAWPNHHRALNTITRYYFREKDAWDRRKLPPECYFQRALNFAPDDATTHMLYGIYLQKAGKLKSAEENYKKALDIEPEHAQANYNYGLLLVKLKQYEKAKELAKKAYGQSFPLPGLKDMLSSVGYWP